MGGDAWPKKKPIARLLEAARLDLDAATRLLAEPPNVLAATHLQRAAEKIVSAVRLHRGLLNTKDHDLVILIDGRPQGEPRPLPAGDPWRDRFRPLESLSAYATTFRYSLTPMPKIDDLRRILATLLDLHNTARTELLTETG
jgi:HEPN domain